jgi:hypothetical protein
MTITADEPIRARMVGCLLLRDAGVALPAWCSGPQRHTERATPRRHEAALRRAAGRIAARRLPWLVTNGHRTACRCPAIARAGKSTTSSRTFGALDLRWLPQPINPGEWPRGGRVVAGRGRLPASGTNGQLRPDGACRRAVSCARGHLPTTQGPETAPSWPLAPLRGNRTWREQAGGPGDRQRAPGRGTARPRRRRR